MNPAAILSLISDLYSQVSALTQANERLTKENRELQDAHVTPPAPAEQSSAS